MLSVQCPQCETHLSLDPQVIRHSLGWARCGHCQHVFDAAQVALPTLAPQVPPQLTNAMSANWPSLDLPGRTEEASPDSTAPANASERVEALNGGLDAEENRTQAFISKDDASSGAVSVLRKSTDSRATTPSEDAVSEQLDQPDSASWRPEVRDPVLSEKFDSSAHIGAWGIEDPSAGTNAREQLLSIWKWMGLALLLSVLAAQLVFGQREHIAARWPAVSEPLKRMSDALGLSFESIKDVRQLHIAHSSITRIDNLQFQLELEVKNDGLLAVALPQLELSLLDGEGHIWTRKVLALDIQGQENLLLNPQSRQTAQTSWRMNEEDAAKVDGYRLRLVYPAGN